MQLVTFFANVLLMLGIGRVMKKRSLEIIILKISKIQIFIILNLGVTMEMDEILKFAKRPVGATIVTVVQFCIMTPFLGSEKLLCKILKFVCSLF